MAETVYYSKKQQAKDQVARQSVPFLAFFSLEYAFIHFLPRLVHGFFMFLLCLMIFSTSVSAYRELKISEFLVPLSSMTFLLLKIPDISEPANTIQFPAANFNSSTWAIITNIIVISLMLQWNWFAYRVVANKIIKKIILILTVIVYPIAIISQIMDIYAAFTYTFSIIFLLSLQIFSILIVKPFYPSPRLRHGRRVLLVASSSFLSSIIFLLIYPSTLSLSIAHLILDVFVLFNWYIIFINAETLIMSKHQSLKTAKRYYQIKMGREEKDQECIIFDVFNGHFKNIPEKIISEIDDDDLTNLWINLQ
ncbi:MAG: hypothetical protein INQ03_00050 [Candidatus Heimdallarchaeota archaeon]|nr:hypothetical protein [Candidatus Heimdallarchaeota archaeon]